MLFKIELECLFNRNKRDIFQPKITRIPDDDITFDKGKIFGYGYKDFFWYLEEDEMTSKGKYLIKYDQYDFEYTPNRQFEKFEFWSYDIDDFGDDDEGWEDFYKANDEQEERFNNTHKITTMDVYIKEAENVDLDKLFEELSKGIMFINKKFLDSVN